MSSIAYVVDRGAYVVDRGAYVAEKCEIERYGPQIETQLLIFSFLSPIMMSG